jgi:hypothetical protein
MGIDIAPEFGEMGAHTARLFNAPTNLAMADETKEGA